MINDISPFPVFCVCLITKMTENDVSVVRGEERRKIQSETSFMVGIILQLITNTPESNSAAVLTTTVSRLPVQHKQDWVVTYSSR
jgi:hypothetical protein